MAELILPSSDPLWRLMTETFLICVDNKSITFSITLYIPIRQPIFYCRTDYLMLMLFVIIDNICT